MHHISAYTPTVSLFSRAGEVWAYRSMTDAYDALGYNWICRNVGKRFRLFSHATTEYQETESGYVPVNRLVYITADFVMRDDFGRELTGGDFQAIYDERRRLRYAVYGFNRHYAFWNGEGPVPGIHRHSAGRHNYRRIRHMNERRWAIPIEDEPAPRGKRNHNNLPNPWDDYHIAAREDRCWKRNRRTQWKA